MQNERADQATVKAIAFLARNEALHHGFVPWDTYRDEESVSQIDYTDLMGGPTRGEFKAWQLPPDFVQAIEEALYSGAEDVVAPPAPSAASARPVKVSWDTCAWYQPIHFFGQDWGIFVREECLLRLALNVACEIDPVEFAKDRSAAAAAKLTTGETRQWARLLDSEPWCARHSSSCFFTSTTTIA